MKKSSAAKLVMLFIATAMYLFLVVKTAWISDDAYITFRPVENLIHGYGPVYNVGERVQAFTHPLWFFLLSLINTITQKIGAINPWAQTYYVALFLSLGISLLVFILIGVHFRTSTAKLAFVSAVLISSKAFIDYSTSGLENPLSHLLLVLFLIFFLWNNTWDFKRICLASFLAGLATLNRQDTLLLFIPALITIFLQAENKWKALSALLIGFSPIILWTIFSTLYYGIPVPNTALAKLNTGIARMDLVQQGWNYFRNSFRIDPVTLTIIFLAILGLIVSKGRSKVKSVVWGIIFYLAYVMLIGGDFMSGRFFTTALIAAVFIIDQFDNIPDKLLYLAAGVAIILGILMPLSPLRSSWDYGGGEFRQYIDENGISDERAVYYPYLGWLSPAREKPPPGSKFAGQEWQFEDSYPVSVRVVGPLGVAGYQAGPNVHMIDYNALSDPLLSRLPVIDPENWRIGHFKREIPEGYLETLELRQNNLQSEDLSTYYSNVELVVRGRLFDPKRLAAIWELFTGKYDYLLENYRNSQ